MNGRTDRRTDRQKDGRKDGQTDKRMDGRTDGQTDGRTDRQTISKRCEEASKTTKTTEYVAIMDRLEAIFLMTDIQYDVCIPSHLHKAVAPKSCYGNIGRILR